MSGPAEPWGDARGGAAAKGESAGARLLGSAKRGDEDAGPPTVMDGGVRHTQRDTSWSSAIPAWMVVGVGVGMMVAAHQLLADGPALLGASSVSAEDTSSELPSESDLYDDGLAIAMLNTIGGALVLLALMQWFFTSPAINALRRKAEHGELRCRYMAALASACVLALAAEVWSATITFRVVGWTARAYKFEAKALLNNGMPSELLVHGTLQPSGIRYTIFPRQLSEASLREGPPYKVADLDSQNVPRPLSNPGTVSIAARVDVGSFDELEHERGLAHFAEHLAFDTAYGKKMRKRYGIWHALDKLGVQSNAYTANRATVYELDAFRNDTQTITSVFQILNQQLFHTMPVQERMDVEKGAVIGENIMRNDTGSQIESFQECFFFGEQSTMCSREPIGLVETVASFTAHDVQAFLNRWYKPSRVHLYVAGDVDGSHVEGLVSSIFANASRGGREMSKDPAYHNDPTAGSHAEIFNSSTITREMRMHSSLLGFDGVTFELRASDPVSSVYELPPFRASTRLRHIHENLFAYIYAHMVLEQSAKRYGNEVSEEMPDIDASAALQDSYEMASRFHSWKLHVGTGLGGEKATESVKNNGNIWASQWRTELHSALVELRRLALHGPDPMLLEKAVEDYRKKNQRMTDSFYDLDTHEIVEQLYGEIGHVAGEQNLVWHSPAVIEEDELSMTHPSMLLAAYHSVQAEARLLWDAILTSVYSKMDDDDSQELARIEAIIESIRLQESEEKSSKTPWQTTLTPGRAVFTVSSAPIKSSGQYTESARFLGTSSAVGLNKYTLRGVVLSVAELALTKVKSSLETVKSDNELFFVDKEDDLRWRGNVRHRKYFKRPLTSNTASSVLHKVRQKERRTSTSLSSTSSLPSESIRLFSKSGEKEPRRDSPRKYTPHETHLHAHSHKLADGGNTKVRLGKHAHAQIPLQFLERDVSAKNVSEMVTELFGTALGRDIRGKIGPETYTNRGNSLIDLDRLLKKFTSAMEVAALLDARAKESTFKNGANVVESDEKSGIVRYQLLNGIGVNVKPMNSGSARLPSVHRGELRMEIVSLGGRATLPVSLVGGCDVIEASKVSVASYGNSGNIKFAEDKKQPVVPGEFQGIQYYHRGTPFRDEEEFPSDVIISSLENAGELSSEWAGLSDAVKSAAEERSLPEPPSAPTLSCNEEHTVISVPLLGKCKVHSTCTPEIVPTGIFIPTLCLARVAMRPFFTSRSLRQAYAVAVEAEAARERDHDPSSVSAANGINKLLRTFLEKSKTFSGKNDHRLNRVTPKDIAQINPLALTDWVREQFLPERTEINIVGEIPDRRELLAVLNLIFGTIPRFNATAYAMDHNGEEEKVSLDPYNPADAKYFKRTWPTHLSKAQPEATEQACYVRDSNPRRAFVDVLVPTFDVLQPRGSVMGHVAKQMASRLLNRAIRMHNGLSYFTHMESFHSCLFPKWGYWHGSWLTGNQYAVRDKKADPLNARLSIRIGTTALSASLMNKTNNANITVGEMNEYFFDADKALLLGRIRSKYQSAEPWLEILRGMSLPLPVNMAKVKGGAAGDEKMMRGVQEALLIEGISELTYEQFMNWMRKNSPSGGVDNLALKSIVETVDVVNKPFMAKVECDPND